MSALEGIFPLVGMLKLHCLLLAETTTECPLGRGVPPLWEVKNVVFVCDPDHN